MNSNAVKTVCLNAGRAAYISANIYSGMQPRYTSNAQSALFNKPQNNDSVAKAKPVNISNISKITERSLYRPR